MRAFMRAIGLGRFFGESDQPERRMNSFTLKLICQSQPSRDWAAERWTAEDENIFIRVCYYSDELSSNDMALIVARRWFNTRKHRGDKLVFDVIEVDAVKTPTLVDDMVDHFPPELLITRTSVRKLIKGEVCMDSYMEGELNH